MFHVINLPYNQTATFSIIIDNIKLSKHNEIIALLHLSQDQGGLVFYTFLPLNIGKNQELISGELKNSIYLQWIEPQFQIIFNFKRYKLWLDHCMLQEIQNNY